jgi:hypothetical protein
MGKALGEKGLLHPLPALWLPNLVVGGIAVHLFVKALRESPLAIAVKWDNAFSWAGAKWTKIWQRA